MAAAKPALAPSYGDDEFVLTDEKIAPDEFVLTDETVPGGAPTTGAATPPPAALGALATAIPLLRPALSDPTSTNRLVIDRALNAAASLPGLPADIVSIIAANTPRGAAQFLPVVGPAVLAEQTRQAESPGSMTPLGGENIREALRDYDVLPTPRAPKGLFERWAGNLGDFLGGLAFPGGSVRSLFAPAVGGATGLTAAQEVAPESPLTQFLASLAGGLTPGALEAALKSAGSRSATVAKTAAETLSPSEKALRVQTGEKLLTAGAEPMAIPETPGVMPTTGQLQGKEGVLALEKSLAALKDAPEISEPMVNRVAQNLENLRSQLDDIRSMKGVPDEARAFAEQQLTAAADEAERTLSGLGAGRGQAVASTEALGRLKTFEGAMRQVRQDLWENRPWASRAHVDLDKIEGALQDVLKGETVGSRQAVGVAEEGQLPAAAKELLGGLRAKFGEPPAPGSVPGVEVVRYPPAAAAPGTAVGPAREAGGLLETAREAAGKPTLVPVKEVNALRTQLREAADKAMRSGDRNAARVYGLLEGRVGKYLDTELSFKDAEAAAGYKTAREFSAMETRLLRDAEGVSRALGTEMPGTTLGHFLQKGPKGRDLTRQLLAVDNSPEMQSMITDWLVEAGARSPEKILRDYKNVLDEMPVVKQRVEQAANVEAAAKALRASPLGDLAGMTPQNFVEKLAGHKDAVRYAKQLERQMEGNPRAWKGMQRVFADWAVDQVATSKTIDAFGRRGIVPDKLASLNREYADLVETMLGKQALNTLKTIEERARMVTREAARGAGSDTVAKATGLRYIDRGTKSLMHESLPATMAIGGTHIGGPAGGLGGWWLGTRLQGMYGASQQQARMLLRDALLDPKLANELMMEAQAAKAGGAGAGRGVRPGVQPWLDMLGVAAVPGAAESVAREQAEPVEEVQQPWGPEAEVEGTAEPGDSAAEEAAEEIEGEPGSWLQ